MKKFLLFLLLSVAHVVGQTITTSETLNNIPTATTMTVADGVIIIQGGLGKKASSTLMFGVYQQADPDLAGLSAATGTNTIYYRAGAGTWIPVTIGANLTFSGGTLAATGGGAGTWGSITGLLPNQTDLQAALDAKQPLDSDLTAIAALTTTPFGRGLLDDADATTARITLGLVIGTNVQAFDSDLTTYASITPSANVQTFLGAPNYAAMRTQLGLVVGTDVLAPNGSGAALTGITGTQVSFADTDNNWTAVNVQAALEELDDVINSGLPNAATGKVSFSQLVDVPAGIADGVDDVSGGGGDSTAIHDDVANEIVAIADKATPVVGDHLLIEDSAAANVKKDITIGSLEVALESILDLPELQGVLVDAQIPAAISRDSEVAAAFQPLDSDLTSIAALTTTAFGRSLLTQADATATRSTLGLVIGTNVQAFDTDLATYAGITPSANVQTFLSAANYAAMRTQLGLVIGTDVQAFDADLTTYAGITPSANVQSFLAAANYAAMRTQLTLVPGTDVQAFDADLSAIAALAGTNTIYYRSAANTWTPVTIGTNLTFTGGTLAATGGVAWGSITGSLPAQTDLQAALDAKQPLDADLTALAASAGTNTIYYRSAANTWSPVVIGTNLTFGGGTLSASGGTGSPGGSGTQVQFNDGGVFGGDTGFTYDKATDTLFVPNITVTTLNAPVLSVTDLHITTFDFEGATVNAFQTALTVVDPTADRTAVLPDADTKLPIFSQHITFTGPTVARTVIFPDTNFTVARVDAANTFVGRQLFSPTGTIAGINVGSFAGDPSTPLNGDMWYDSTANELTARINGVNVALGAGGGGTDVNAVHVNVAGEINAVADKATPVVADHLLIEDSAATNAKKDITIGSQETALEGVMDLPDMQGVLVDAQIPAAITRDAEAAAAYQPLDSDLTSIAALTTTTFGRAWLTETNSTSARTTLGVVPGTNVQAFDADLTTYAGITPSANVQSLLGAADYAAMRTQLGLVIGTNVQAFDSDLTTYAGITPSANVQSLLGAADYSAMRTQLGLVIGTNVQAFDADLTSLSGASGTNTIYYRSAADTWTPVVIGSGVSFTGGTISATAASALPRGYLSGLTLSNNVTDAVNDIDIAVGTTRDNTNAHDITLAAALTKRLDATWTVGTGNGGLDTGAIANNTYHVWAIKRSDTSVCDILFSLSPTTPTMPANYDFKRRIGSIVRAGATILAFRQNGSFFQLNTPVMDVDTSTLGTTSALQTLASVPTGLKLHAVFNAFMNNAAITAVYIRDPDQTDQAPTNTASPLNTLRNPVVSQGDAARLTIQTNTSAQVAARSGAATTTLRLATIGWIDQRDTDVMASGSTFSRTGVRRTIYVNAGAMVARVTNGAAAATVETTTNDIMYDGFGFDSTVEEGVGFWFAPPTAYDGGTITFKPRWTSASGTGTVKWDFAARAYADDDPLDAALGTEQTTGTDTLLAAGDMHVSPTTPALTPAGTPAAGRDMYVQITRDVGGDTLNADAVLLGVTVEYNESSTEPVAQ